ncbi:MAG: VWA domain-containing protein [Phycisphaerales bacterium]
MTSFASYNPLPLTLALQFLAPAAGLIAGSIAVPAFLFFYFLKLRRRPLRVSSTLFWEQAVSDLQVNAPFRWIRPSLLLFIQLLALMCLLIAIARPAIEGGVGAERVIVAIDTSASMASRDSPGGPSRFERAVKDASEYISSLPPQTEVMVVSVSGTTRTVTNFTRNRGLTKSAVDSLRQTDQPAGSVKRWRCSPPSVCRAERHPKPTRLRRRPG